MPQPRVRSEAMPARCPNPECKSDEFQAEKCPVRGIKEPVEFIACLICGRFVGVVQPDLTKRLESLRQEIEALSRRVR